MSTELEWLTRKKRIDPKLDDSGWKLGLAGISTGAWRTEEEPTALGPADYALWSGGKVVGVVEALRMLESGTEATAP